MTKEMPRKHWDTLPEASIIEELLRDAPDRVRLMLARQSAEPGAEPFIPPPPLSLPVLREAAQDCLGCSIGELASQAVMGEGPVPAKIMLVGEQPGDEEDKAGRPFVGPAGRLLDQALVDAGVNRAEVYVTNAVKHFKYEARGKRRIHKKPSAAEVRACHPWLQREIVMVNPRAIVLLGATAAQSIFGPAFRVTKQRGQWITHSGMAARLLATVHPSAILRADEASRDEAYAGFVADLRLVAAFPQH